MLRYIVLYITILYIILYYLYLLYHILDYIFYVTLQNVL